MRSAFVESVERSLFADRLSPEPYQNIPKDRQPNNIHDELTKHLEKVPLDLRGSVRDEMTGWGPVESLRQQEDITEILINGPSEIWYEKQGQLYRHDDTFSTSVSFENFCNRLMDFSQQSVTLDQPILQGSIEDFRLQLVSSEVTHSSTHISLRRRPKSSWTFQKLLEHHWATPRQFDILRNLIRDQKNLLVVGGTGSGKTSVISACLKELTPSERCVLIEDTFELHLPNGASMKLLTRTDPQGSLRTISQLELVKSALRLRPDRIIMGEIRGEEAKDFLMALSSGHQGCLASMHAENASQALTRLEMLVQLGAPQWDLLAVRRLIQTSLSHVVVVGKNRSGQRCLQGIYHLTSLEESGFLVERIDA